VYGTKYEYGPIATTIYPASGSSADYTYGAANVLFSYGVELRDTGQHGFLLPADQVCDHTWWQSACVRTCTFTHLLAWLHVGMFMHACTHTCLGAVDERALAICSLRLEK